MFGQEANPPYDRPVISKNLNAKIEKLLLRSPEWLKEEAAIEWQPNARVKDINVNSKTITTEQGDVYSVDKVREGGQLINTMKFCFA